MIVVLRQMSNFQLHCIARREQVTFQLGDDDVRFVLIQHVLKNRYLLTDYCFILFILSPICM